MKTIIASISLILSFSLLADTKLVHFQNFTGESAEEVIELCEEALASDSRCSNDKFVCECANDIAFTKMNYLMIEEIVEDAVSVDNSYVDTDYEVETFTESCTFVEVRKERDGYEIGRRFKRTATAELSSDALKSACREAKKACKEDKYYRTKCVKSDRVTPGVDYAENDEDYTGFDAVMDGIDIVTDIISLFN